MKPEKTDDTVQAKMETTLALFEASIQIMQQNLRRRYPHETEEQLQRHFRLWLHKGTTFESTRDGGQDEPP